MRIVCKHSKAAARLGDNRRIAHRRHHPKQRAAQVSIGHGLAVLGIVAERGKPRAELILHHCQQLRLFALGIARPIEQARQLRIAARGCGGDQRVRILGHCGQQVDRGAKRLVA